VLLASGAYVAFAVRQSMLSRDPAHVTRARARWSVPDAVLVAGVPTVYHVFLGVIALVQDRDGAVSRGQSLMLWLTCAVSSTLASMFLALGLFTWSPSAESAVNSALHALQEQASSGGERGEAGAEAARESESAAAEPAEKKRQ